MPATMAEAVQLAEKAGRLMRARRLTLSTAESATGGLIAALITEVAGSSDYFLGAVVAYSNRIKNRVLGVSTETLDHYGAVSKETGKEMAEGVRRVLGTDLGLSDTGIAGPGGATPAKPLGLFYLGLATPSGTDVTELHLNGNRSDNRLEAAYHALSILAAYLERGE